MVVAEAMPLVKGLKLESTTGLIDEKLPMRVFKGHVGEGEVHVVWNGKSEEYQVDRVRIVEQRAERVKRCR